MKTSKFVLMTVLAGVLAAGCTDDDEQSMTSGVSLSAPQETYSEGDGSVTLSFTANNIFVTDTVLAYEVSGTAVAGEDYETLSGTLSLPAGQTTVDLNVILIDDDQVATERELVLTLVSVNGSSDFIGTADSVTLTITDNDSFAYENGILVLHEGNFFVGNASVSFVTDDLANTSNSIFNTVNTAPLGDTAQSMAFNDGLAYIVVNNSQKIEVVNRYTFESVATIDNGLLNPRYMAFANGKGYVTNWGDGSDTNDDFVAVIDLDTYTVVSTIAVPEGPEWILSNGDTIYVAHQGGFNQNNIVSVIDARSNTTATPITVADRPNSMQFADDALWVLSGGNPSWAGNETAGQLDKVDLASNTVVETFEFAVTEHPGYLSVDDDTLYYLMAGDVFLMDAEDTALPGTAIISGVAFYDMAVDDGKLYGVDAKDFASNGSLEVYDLTSNTLDASLEVSIIPSGIYFNDDFEF